MAVRVTSTDDSVVNGLVAILLVPRVESLEHTFRHAHLQESHTATWGYVRDIGDVLG